MLNYYVLTRHASTFSHCCCSYYQSCELAIEKVFMRFYTELSSRTNSDTSGLGLYMSKKLVEWMNGKIHAELEDNWFILHIYLPR
ncbi:ATP-binding protein [Bacillus sp. B1-b2]|uniref:ATP-binding protein n=1 Tax=Bacillus sp. B1-b2 TaxID=2653201 RepID=UPI0021F8010E|nr:ATP-binding protein [Bacillus sp. B1-b2]